MNSKIKMLRAFFERALKDQRLAPSHISVYVGICQRWIMGNFKDPILVAKDEMMKLGKLSGKSTYYKVMRELHEFGYIDYIPASGRHEQSFVRLRSAVLKCIALLLLKIKTSA